MAGAATQSALYERTFTSFGGPDIVPIFNNRVIGECQAITYSIRREKAPVYTFGSADPRSYARGKRGIAGSVVFVQFDRHALIEELQNVRTGQGPAVTRDIPGTNGQFVDDYSNQGVVLPASNYENSVLGVDTWGHSMTSMLSQAGAGAYDNFTDLLQAAYVRRTPWYSDQLPAFHITLTMANEQGQAASMRILYAEILNEGVGMSVDDTVIEQAMTFVARRIIPIKSATDASFDFGAQNIPIA